MAKSGTKGTSRLLSQSSESLTPSSYTLHEALIKPNKPVNGNETLDITGIITKFNINSICFCYFLNTLSFMKLRIVTE